MSGKQMQPPSIAPQIGAARSAGSQNSESPPIIQMAPQTQRQVADGELLSEIPKFPSGKQQEFKERWKQYARVLIDSRILTERFLPALEALCDAHQALVNADRDLERDDKYMMNPNGSFSRHPAFTTKKEAQEQIHRYQVALGLTPSAARHVAEAPPKKPKVSGMSRRPAAR